MANIDSVKLPNGNEYNLQDVVTPRMAASQPNLLINGWFTVNQRGWTSGSASDYNYCVDQWVMISSGTIAASSSGLTCTPSGGGMGIRQIFEDYSLLTGKTLTFSALLSDGTIISGTVTNFNPTTNTAFIDDRTASGLWMRTIYASSQLDARITITKNVTIRAVKLEIGSTSTLHLDTAPDYTTELLKCQRYFRRIGSVSNNGMVCLAFASNSTNGYAIIPLSTPMRVNPTLSVSGEYKFASYTVSYSSVTVSLNSASDCRDRLMLNLVGSGLPSAAGGFLVSGSTSYMDFSAEL